jgi:predicted ABC-type ATPase
MKKMVIMAGISGAGKSTVAKRLYDGWKTIDCDELKKLCDGYDPKNPSAVHEESKRLEKIEITKAICGDENFVYDTTATHAERIVSLIKEAQSFGWFVEILYVKVKLATALKRNASRERVVPEYIVREKNAVIAQSIEIISSYADRLTVVNND